MNQEHKTMKTPMIAMLLLAGLTSTAQDKDIVNVPEAVKSAFAQRFPKAEGTKWELEDKTDYEAGFKQAGVKYSAKFSATGAWMETEHKIKKEALPELVQKALAANYAGYKVEGAEQAETPEGMFYEVDLEKGEQEMEVLFSADGKVVKSQVEEEHGEDDDRSE